MLQILTSKKYTLIYIAFAFLAGVIYFYFTMAAPETTSGASLGLTGLKLLIVKATFALPYALVGVIGAFAASKLKYLKTQVGDEAIRDGYGALGNGILILVTGQIFLQLVGLVRSYYPENYDLVAFVTVLTNYVNALIPIVAFFYVYRGAKIFSEKLKEKFKDIDYLSLFITGIIGIVLVLLVFTNPIRQVSSIPGVTPTYYIPDILIAITLVIPILIGWFLGFRSAFILSESILMSERERINFSRLSNGLLLVIFSSILLQGITSAGTERLISFGLGGVLALIYAFVVTLGAGYGMIALSSKDQQK